MEEVMIERFNSVIKPGDRLYHLGDMAWSSYNWNLFVARLQTKELHFIWGNHDKREAEKKYLSVRSWADIRKLKIDGYTTVMCHYAMRSWEGRNNGAFHCYGHSHGKLPGIGRSMDVGCDTNNFYPWAWEDIRDRLKDIRISDDPKYLPEGGSVDVNGDLG